MGGQHCYCRKAQLKTDVEDGLRQWFIKCSYGLCSSFRKLEEEKESFWNELFHLVRCIPQNEMVVLAGDMNGHVGSSNVGYDGKHCGFGYGDRNADGSRILEFVGKKLCFGFVDLEKAFDRIPTEVIKWAMHKLGVEEWLVSAVVSIYTGAKTVVRTVYGTSNGFEIKIGSHQGSALSPLLFVIVMEALSREFRVALP